MKNNLAKLREKFGWTQQEVAERLGTTKTTIYRIESGRQSLENWIEKFLILYDCSIADLYDASDVQNAKNKINKVAEAPTINNYSNNLMNYPFQSLAILHVKDAENIANDYIKNAKPPICIRGKEINKKMFEFLILDHLRKGYELNSPIIHAYAWQAGLHEHVTL